MVNFSKSAISFSSCVLVKIRQCLCNELGVNEVAEEGNYLGVPVSVGRKKKAIFAYLKYLVWQKIQSWKSRPLSRARKEIFIKIVLQALQNFIMSLFLLPVDIYDEIEKMLKGYWWGNGGTGGIKWFS